MPRSLPRLDRVIAGLAGLCLLSWAAAAARAGAEGTQFGTVNGSSAAQGIELRVALWTTRERVPEAREAVTEALGAMEQALAGAADDAELAATAAAWVRRSDGAYDPAALPLYRLWESCRALGRVPRADELDAAAGAPGFGLVAAGRAADLAADGLRAAGFPDHLLVAGPIERVAGSRGGKPWRLAVEHPAGTGLLALGERRPGGWIRLDHDVEFFRSDGCSFAGLLNPRSGRPVHGTALVLAFAPTAADAAALAAALPVLGPRDGLRLAAAVPGCEAIAVDADGAVHASAGLRLQRGRLEWLR